MSLIQQTLHNINSLTNQEPLLLSSHLSQPIHLNGEIHDKALIRDFIQQIEVQAGINESKNQRGSDINPEDNDRLITIDIGVDEVGRGPLYGSVVIAGAILPSKWSAEIDNKPLQDTPLAILTDSKKLSEVKREQLYEPIKTHSLGYIMVEIPAEAIDEVNILQATLLGMRLACEQLMIQIVNTIQNQPTQINLNSPENSTLDIKKPLSTIHFRLLIDGNTIPILDDAYLKKMGVGNEEKFKVTAESWVKGDARHTAIAAASVLAKVSRDRQVIADGLLNPGYGLESHKGYPTRAHIEALNTLGVLPQHRRSFKPVKDALNNA